MRLSQESLKNNYEITYADTSCDRQGTKTTI